MGGGSGATVRKPSRRRGHHRTSAAVTTAKAKSFCALSGAGSGRKAITTARLASKNDVASPLALPPRPLPPGIFKSAVMDGDAAIDGGRFNEYFSMDYDYDEEEDGPRGCLLTCCADDSFY